MHGDRPPDSHAAQARPADAVGHQVAQRTASKCTLLISGTAWHLRGSGTISGNKYMITAVGMSCSGLARSSALKFMKLRNPGLGKTFRGPSGFACRSMTPPSVGATLVISALCQHQPGKTPFFAWAPKVG
jgi:hypothetical protein